MQILLNGIAQGALFAMMGMAFALVYHTTRVFHVALGGIYAIAPYLLLTAINMGMHWTIAIGIALSMCGLLGLLCEETLHWPFLRKSAPPEVHLIGSLGAYLVMVQTVVVLWGNDTLVLRAGIDSVYTFFNLRLAGAQLAGLAASILLVGGFLVYLRLSSVGLQFRAMADNPVLLSLLGRNVRRLRRLVFALSAVMAAAAAIASAYDVGFDSHSGLRVVLGGMAAAIIGGRGSFVGAAVAGLLLGVIRSEVVWYASARWEEAATFLILALALVFWPQGLLGRALRLEEKA